MFFLKLTVLYILIYGIMFLSGWGICENVCKGKNAEYKLLLAPIIGIIPLATIPMYFSFLGFKAAISGWITFIVFASISLYYLIKYPASFKKANYHSPYLLLFLILAVSPSFVIILKAGYLTTTLQSYSSPIIYLSEYFSQNSAIDKVNLNFYKPLTNMFVEVSKVTPFVGHLFFIATISSILNILPYKLYLILSGIGGSIIPISVFIACKEGFKLEKKITLLISFLISINISYFFWPMIGHFPFITGIVYLILGFGFIPGMLECKERRDYIFYSLIFAGLMSIYFQLMPYIFGVVILYIFLRKKISFQNLLMTLKNIGIISLITFTITPFVFIFLVRRSLEFTAITSKIPKNVPRFPYMEELFGFGQHFSMRHDGSLKYYLLLLFTIILIWFICAGLYNCLKNRNIIFLSVCGFIFILGAYFSLIDFTYHFYKHSIIGVFMMTSTLVIGGDFLYKKINHKIIKISIVSVLLVFIVLNVRTYIKVALKSSHSIVTKSYIDLENISKIVPGNKRILVNSQNPTEEVWISYFLKGSKIKLRGAIEPWGFWIFSHYSGKPNFNFFYDFKKDKIDYTLSNKSRHKADIVNVDFGEIAYENEDYILSKSIPNPYLFKGWHNPEKNNSSVFRWTQKESFVLFRRPYKNSVLHIKGTVPSVHKKPIEIIIKINDKLIDKFSSDESLDIDKQYPLDQYPLKNNNNELSIILSDTFVPNELWGYNDLRRLGMRIYGINIFPLKNIAKNNI